MMPRLSYRLLPSPGGGFHLGREGLEQETSSDTFPSDSLFSAVVATVAQVYGEEAVETLVAAVQHEGVLRLSSAFPILGSLPLFPLPRLRVNLTDYQPKHGKRLKKVRYVSLGVLNRLVREAPMDAWLPVDNAPSQGILLNGGNVWVAAEEQSQLPDAARNVSLDVLMEMRFWNVGVVPRVTIDRATNASSIFQVGRTVFSADCGLWFMADVADTYENVLDTVIHMLGDSGIGGERSAGYGKFSPELIPSPALDDPSRTNRVLALSRYHPRLDELEAGVLTGDIAYDLVDVGGWLHSAGHKAQRRQRVRMIESGSVLNGAYGIPVGQLQDVRPTYEGAAFPHSVYRSGIAMFAGVPGGKS
jgi:CRISPR-associated protein Csm4